MFKHEINGFDLRQINTDHNMPNTTALSNAKDIDKYYLGINRGTQASGDSQVSFASGLNVGGSNILLHKLSVIKLFHNLMIHFKIVQH